MAELLFLRPHDPSGRAADLMLALLVERGVDFAWSGHDELPGELCGMPAGPLAIVYDAAHPDCVTPVFQARLKALAGQGVFVLSLPAVAAPLSVEGEGYIRWLAETVILSGGLREQHPDTLARLAGRSEERLLGDMLRVQHERYWQGLVGWTDVQGWFWRALELLHELTGRAEFMDDHAALIDESISRVENRAESINRFAGLQSVLYRYGQTGERRYLDYARTRLDRAITDYPAIDGVPVHDPATDRCVWPEATAMLCPALALMSRTTGEPRYGDYAKHALRKMTEWCIDPADGLWQHGGLPGKRFGAKWGRGNGWALYGWKETLRRLPPDDPFIAEGSAILSRAAKGYRQYQDPACGLWRNVIDRPEARIELTGSAIITGAYAAALRHGWVKGPQTREMVDKAWRGCKSKIWRGHGCTQVIGTGLANHAQYYLGRPQALGRPTHLITAWAEMQFLRRAEQLQSGPGLSSPPAST